MFQGLFFAAVCCTVTGAPLLGYVARGERLNDLALKLDRNPKYIGSRPLSDVVGNALLCICQQVVQTRGPDGPAADNVCATKWCATFQRNDTCGPTTGLGQLEQCVVSNKEECYLSFPDLTSTAATLQYLSAIQQCYAEMPNTAASTAAPSDNPIDSIYW